MTGRRSWSGGERGRILLLHGSTSSAATWWQTGPALAARGFSVVAVDLLSHGASPGCGGPLLPRAAATALAANLGRGFDLVLGHSFGAAVALVLAARMPARIGALVLEELPGPTSVAWQAEADAVRGGAVTARADTCAAVAATRAAQPRWAVEDCRHSVVDLAACRDAEVSAGLELGHGWTTMSLLARVRMPVLLLLAPDQPGVNHLQDETALRGEDRAATVDALSARAQVVDAGHCIHRDDPDAWVAAVQDFAATPR